MDGQRTSAQSMLDSSQRVREQLVAAVDRLDAYIDLLKAELSGDTREGLSGGHFE